MFFAGSVISSITSGLSNSFTCTERMSLKSWIENLVIHVAKLSKMEEGVGRLGMEFGGGTKQQRVAWYGVTESKRGPQDGARMVEGNRVPRISVMRHRCTGCWCQRASPSVELEQECSFSALLLSLSPPLSLPMYVKVQSS